MKHFLSYLFLFIAIGCSKNNNENSNLYPQNINSVTLEKGLVFNLNYHDSSQQNIVISNQNDWSNFINNVWFASLTPPAINIDFNNYMIIASIDQLRTSGGYDLNLSSVIENENNIIIHLQHIGNGDLTDVITRPYQIIKIPKSTKPIVFQ